MISMKKLQLQRTAVAATQRSKMQETSHQAATSNISIHNLISSSLETGQACHKIDVAVMNLCHGCK